MARSRASRRRRADNVNNIPYARMRPNVVNWTIGGSATDNTGQVITSGTPPVPSGPATWTPVGFNLTDSIPLTFQAVTIVAAPNTSTPTIGRMKIDEMKGRICFNNPSLPLAISVAVCVYVSEFNSSTGKWDVRDPMNVADAARDDYFYLEAMSISQPDTAAQTGNSGYCFDLKLANPLVIGGGQALHVTVSFVTALAGVGGETIYCHPAFRTRVGSVA